MQRILGKGRAFHYAFLLGMFYILSWAEMKSIISNTLAKAKLLTSYSSEVRNSIISRVKAAGVETAVQLKVPMIETPRLLSKAGAAVTLLNWLNNLQKNLNITVKVRSKSATMAAFSPAS